MTAQDRPAMPSVPGKRNAILLRIAALTLSILCGVAAWRYFSWRWSSSTDDAYVGGDVVAVTSLTKGTVSSIFGDTTQAITEGQLLDRQFDACTPNQLFAFGVAAAKSSSITGLPGTAPFPSPRYSPADREIPGVRQS